MLVDWPAEPFALRPHRDPSLVAHVAKALDGGAVALVADGKAAPQLWVAERFRVAHARLRHVATDLYLTAEGTGTGAAVTLRPKFPDTGSDTAY
ncbi:RICIN domain-containing protein [Kitasatospora sp. NPDC092948]|uniref:RICIN domain-containing protein n=1 Tax=Kitasatospora sp. NPDC092948 TaxID=3364088 RepID=UPI00382ECD9E